MNPWELMLQWLTKLFQSSGSRALEDSMIQIQAAPLPDFGAKWYQSLWAVNFAVAILLGLVSVIINIVIASQRGQGVRVVNAFKGFAMTFLLGYLLLLALYGAMLALDVVSDLIVLMTTGSTSPEWYQTLIAYKNTTDVPGALMLDAASYISGQFLKFQTWVIMQGMFVFPLLIVLAVSFYVNSAGERFVRWFKAAIISGVLTKTIVIAILAVWATIMKLMGVTGYQAIAGVTSAMVLAASVNVVLFFSFAQKKRSRVQVDGVIKTENSGIDNGMERLSSVPSKRKYQIPNNLTEKAGLTQSRAHKVKIASDGIASVSIMATPKAAAIHPVAGAVVGGLGVVAKSVSAGAGHVEKRAETIQRVTPYIDDTVTFSRNVKSHISEKKAGKENTTPSD